MSDWTPLWRTARIVENREVGHGSQMMSLRLDDEHPFPYEPGHVISLRVSNVEGTVLRHPYTVSMVFPGKRILELLFRVIPGGRLTPTLGLMQDGRVEISGLHHRPVIKEMAADASRFIGISTGSGIGPLYGFAARALTAGFLKPIYIFAGYREESDICLRPELDELASSFSNFHWDATLSRPAESWTGLRGRVTAAVPDLIQDLHGCHFHLVGNMGMVKTFEAALHSEGVAAHFVTHEGFFNWNAEPDATEVADMGARFSRRLSPDVPV